MTTATTHKMTAGEFHDTVELTCMGVLPVFSCRVADLFTLPAPTPS